MGVIVGIGELLWDVFPDGRKVAGGAPFNFAFHCRQLGHDAVVVSRVGDDDLGRELREEVRRLGLTTAFIQTDSDHPTGTVRVSVDAQGEPTYAITEDVAWDYIAWTDTLKDFAFGAVHAVCFGTLGQRSPVSRSTIQAITSNDWTVLPMTPLRVLDLNVRPPHFNAARFEDSVARCDWLKLNDEELHRLAELVPLDHPDGTSQAIELRSVCELGLVCVSRGAGGCFIARIDGDLTEPGVPARVVDTVGAGDAFTAAMVCLHLEGRSLRECARFANHYAARVCEHQGATPRIDRTEVERAAFA